VAKIIGEFYSQTTESFGNYGMFAFLEREGAEVVPPTVMAWVTYLLYQAGDHWHSRRGLDGPFPSARPWQVLKRLANAAHHARRASLFWLAEHALSGVYRRLGRALGAIAHDLLPQAEVARLARPFYNTLLRGGEGHQEIGKHIHCAMHKHAHMVLSLKPFGCMPSQLSDGVQSAVVGRYPDTVFLPVETSGEGEIHVQSRVQMALSEARARAREEFDAALASTGRSLVAIRAYVASHPTLRRAGYRVPPRPGVAGRAARFVLHLSDLMDGDRGIR
jgi:predicted nucleotide-binding protein (sugar kinase/HSP70/actin superfamily)